MRTRAILGMLALAPALSSSAEERAERPTPSVRQQIESLEAHLDIAVARVSVPHAGMLIGRSDTTRGYRLPGYGVLFVLAPRALPGEHAVYVLRRGPGHPGAAPPRVPPDHRPSAEAWESPSDDLAWQPERVEEIERQVVVLQHVAEAERRAAEEDMERIMSKVRIRLAGPSSPPPGPGAQAAVAAADPPPAPPDELQLPATPPWRFWFESGPAADERSPDQVVADVKAAVIGTLESQAGPVASLRGDEFVTVAVDFVAGGLFVSHPRPQRTLVVRVRKRDLDARARGAIGPGDLEKKVEAFEY